MRTAAALSVLAFTLAVSACAGPNPEEFTRADREAIQQSNEALAAAFNAKDVDAIAALYADNSLFMPPNAPSVRGREMVKSFYGGLIAQGASTLRMEADEVSGHGPLAFESGSYTVEFTRDGAPGRDRGKYVRVHRNLAGTWRIEKTIWSSDLPQRPTNAD